MSIKSFTILVPFIINEKHPSKHIKHVENILNSNCDYNDIVSTVSFAFNERTKCVLKLLFRVKEQFLYPHAFVILGYKIIGNNTVFIGEFLD